MKRRALLHPLFLLSILILAAGLRFAYLGRQSLWNDEGTSVAVAQRDLATIARDSAADIHPPLYYVLLSRWVQMLGTSEVAVRSLSALLGIGLVALTYALGRLLLDRWPALAAALLAAISPFQVYYSQEARMYMLLAVISAGAMLALTYWVARPSWSPLATLALLEAAGLWTHYSFVFLALVLNLAFLFSLRRGTLRRAASWVASQAAALLLFAPWLPVALRQARSWPSPGQVAFVPAIAEAWRWLVFGPAIDTQPILAWVVLSALLALAGLAAVHTGSPPLQGLPRSEGGDEAHSSPWWPALLLLLWLGLPVALILGLGLYREAYLKFLLVGSPAVCLLMAAALTWPWMQRAPAPRGRLLLRGAQLGLGAGILFVSGAALRNYYADPAYARDDYRGIASYIGAMGRPGDAILLNAPGQQEAFGYYYRGSLPVHPLPESRPLNPEVTQAALAELAEAGNRIFAVLWATDESDPNRFVEGWLDSHTYKALDSWYGNVRLVVYAVPAQTPTAPSVRLNLAMEDVSACDEITLAGYSLLQETLAAGDIAQVSLFWRAERTPARRYKVFLHVLDEANHIVGQHDGEPGGGALLTTLWLPGAQVADHVGVTIHPATPPGVYRIEVGMYDVETGVRMAAADGATQVWLEPLEVTRPRAPAPASVLGTYSAKGADFGALRLLSYDVYKLGAWAGSGETVQAGDVLHADLYWQADERPEGDWSVWIGLVDDDGEEVGGSAAMPATGFPTSLWQAGDIWRGQIDLPLSAGMRPGRYRLRVLLTSPAGTPADPFLTDPVPIEALH